jgi:hypothetical protein
MPLGRYRVLDHGTPMGTEDFRCAPGPMGWRYFSQLTTEDPDRPSATIDIVVDAAWRPVRARIETGAHAILITAHPGEPSRLTGVRDRVPIEIAWDPAMALGYASPGFDAVLLSRRDGAGEIDIVVLDPQTLEPRVERHRWEPASDDTVDTPVGRFAARRWHGEDASGGVARNVWCAGDVVVHEAGHLELEAYDPGVSGPWTEDATS